MAASISYDRNASCVRYGILGPAQSVPSDFEVWTVVSYSSTGVNEAFMEWGSMLQRFYNSQTKANAESDFTCNYLGYWTDNGGFYYYNTEKNTSYEETILDIKKYADAYELPYRYFQIDSWFYPKEGAGGILEWSPDPNIFPNGLGSPKTPMAKQNGGKYDFIIEKSMALPIDQDIWLDVLSEARQWGLFFYEQASFESFKGQIWSTFSVISDHFFGVIFAAALSDPFSVTPSSVGFHNPSALSYVYKRHEPWTIDAFSDSRPLLMSGCSTKTFCIYYTAPLFSLSNVKIVLLGEMDKWVPFSRDRISSIETNDHDLHVTLEGAGGENVVFGAILNPDGLQNYSKYECVIPASGKVILVLPFGECISF
ncbi:hypothetical protein CAPTEDRAFT_225895 [Capitella teleta]|uniref:Uncharacterized protein n=1 Tax=Capitella teleta TaxID=283909 RepID=R7VGN5_CAPTE|nr:hypothetical protein CAPTEDRAFT_225895 [Capitella teleta]|eukprot:ELU14855.1 hypothetical protein CAPTEDRAFT_225895 [Capitella teleta]